MSNFDYEGVIDIVCGQNHDPALRKFARQCLEFRQGTIDEFRSTLTHYESALKEAKVAFGMDTVWPLLDVLKECGAAMRHLLDNHDCDHEWHEQFSEVEVQLTENFIPKLQSSLATINKVLGEK